MSALVPYGCFAGFILAADMREIAAHYGVRWRLLRHTDGRSEERIAEARDALIWKLMRQRGLSARRSGDLLGATPRAAREAMARHEQRIADFRTGFTVKRSAL